jgi:hypothetical protein
VLIALDVFAVVSAFVQAVRAFDDVRCFDFYFAARQVGKENLFRLTPFAGETKIPLSGG